jgi:hypothetical protein
MKKVLIFPGSFQFVKNYGNYDGWDIWLKPYPKELPVADYYIGHSAGVNFILSHCNSNIKGKFIFINPEIRKRNLLSIIVSFIKVIFTEDINNKQKRVTPVNSWLFGLKTLSYIRKVDVLSIMLKIPKENLIVIRGKKDNSFCDKESVGILKNYGLTIIEVNAGHDWNENIAETVKSCITSL